MTDTTQADQPSTKGTGKSAFITGGSKGIGYSTAEALLKAGYQVTITSRKQDEIQAAAQKLGEGARGEVCDVRDFSAVQSAIDAHVAAFGGLDVLFVNAGLGNFAPVQDLTPEAWSEVIDTNLTGAFFTVKAAIPALSRTQGYVILLSSLAGKNPFAGGSAYNASKFGMNGFSEAIMLDLRPLGIKVSQIMPGSVATPFAGHVVDEQKDAWKIQPEDLAQVVLDLLEMNPRTLPSRIEVRPAQPPRK